MSVGVAIGLGGCTTHKEPMHIRADAVKQLTLENGLAVVWEEDHRQPLVAIEARILGGLRQEGPFLGSGITHFIEHMLFKGTPSRPPGTIDQEVRRYGGTINAFTSHDSTGVSVFVESRFLRDVLGMLADILQHATFPQEEFTKEREVILSELHMNRDDPERRIRDVFWNRHFLVHPYRHPILGYEELLKRLTVHDLATLHSAQYVPNNIMLSCVGDVDSATFPTLIRETFGSWPRGAPYQLSVPEEPPAVSVKQTDEELPIQAAYGLIGFSSIRLAHPDLYALDVLASIVGQGQSSRLHEALVHTRRLADAVGASNYTPLDPGVFSVSLRADPHRLSDALEAALEVLEAIPQRGVTAEELQKAKRQVVADYVFRHQTIESKADDFANSWALTGDPTFSARYVEGIQRVTGEHVTQVAIRYLDRTRMTLVTLQPPRAHATSAPQSSGAQPTVTKTVFSNGLTVLISVDHALPMAAMVAVSRGGVRIETEHTQGLSNLVAQLLVKGTARKTATEIAASVESLGGMLEPFSGRDGLGVALQLLAEDTDQGLGLIHELLTEATFPDDELTLQRHLIAQELKARDDDVFDVSSRLLRRTLFSSHPYRFDPLGSQASIAGLTRAECLRFAKQWLVPSNLVIAVFGDVDEQKVLKTLDERFGNLPRAQVSWPQELIADPLTGIRQASLTLPKEQSVIMLGFRGTRLAAPDRYALDLLTTVLSGMSGRLFQAVREKLGLSYTVGALNLPGWDPGYLVVYAATRPKERAQVLATLQKQLHEVVEHGVREEELAQAKQYLIGAHRLELQHLTSLAKRCALDELYGLGADAWTQYESRITAVTLPMIQQAAKRYLTLPQRAEVVVEANGSPPRVSSLDVQAASDAHAN